MRKTVGHDNCYNLLLSTLDYKNSTTLSLDLRPDFMEVVVRQALSVADPDLYRRGCKLRAWSVNAVSWYIILWLAYL